MNDDMMIYGVAGLAFIAIAGIGLAFAGGGQSEKLSKRAKHVSEHQGKGRSAARKKDENSQRKRQTQQMLDSLREREVARRKSLVPRDTAAKLQRAGLKMEVTMFWVICALCGIGAATLIYLSPAEGFSINGIEIRSKWLFVGLAAVVGGLGIPNFMLGMLTKRRNKKMTNQFADGIDIVVRGVKSGLPLAECLRIIARESPEPLKEEFERLTDNIAMGTALDRALGQFYRRVPLPEVNFFVIVLVIQSKAGGNLSEALGNLSAVIRSRKMMREKVSALSQEAKASAMIIGALPFAVGVMVYLTTPDYIMKLFTTSTGHFILMIGALMMATGIFIMRKMIDFDM